MFSLLLLLLGALAVWTGIVLFNKGPKDKEIKAVLQKILVNAVELFSNLQGLFTLLKESNSEGRVTRLKTSSSDSPTLIEIKANEDKQKAA